MTDRAGEPGGRGRTPRPAAVGIVTGCLFLAALLMIGGWYFFTPRDEVEVIVADSKRDQTRKTVSGKTTNPQTNRSTSLNRGPYRTGRPALKLTPADGREVLKIDADLRVVYSIAVSPDGKRVLAGGSNTSARVWSLESGKPVDRFDRHRDAISAVTWSPDGTRALTGSRDRSARYWNAKTGELIRVLRGHRWPVLSVAISPDGKRALTGGDRFRLWDLETGKTIHKFDAHRKSVWSVAFAPDGLRALTGSWDGTIRLWDLSNFQSLNRLEGHRELVKCVRFSPSGEYAASCDSSDPVVRIWNLATGATIRELKGHTHGVAGLAFSPDGRYLLTGSGQQRAATGAYLPHSKDRSIRVWNIDEGRELLKIDSHGAYVTSVAFTPDGQSAVAGCGDGTIRVFRIFRESPDPMP